MTVTVFLVDKIHPNHKMRNTRFIEYTIVLILIAVIILQAFSYKSLEQTCSLKHTKQVGTSTEENGQKNDNDHKKRTIYAITPTFARPVQKAELTRLAQTFMHVPTFHWIIVEDSIKKTNLVSNLLEDSGLTYTHLTAVTPPNYKLGRRSDTWKKPRGVEQRNTAMKWLRENYTPNDDGIVFFADDDNTYSIKLFKEMENIKNVGIWPVGLVGGLMVERPICDQTTNKVVGFNSAWKPDRPFSIDMAGFAFNLKLLFQNKDAWFSFEAPPGLQESEILSQITTRDSLEPLADFCTKVYVWHTRTEPPSLSAEQLLIRKGKPSNEGIEV